MRPNDIFLPTLVVIIHGEPLAYRDEFDFGVQQQKFMANKDVDLPSGNLT
jgi:hypothetical protein